MEGVISPCVLSAKKDSPSVVRVKRQGVSSWGGMNTGLAGKRVLSLFLGLFLCMSVFCLHVCMCTACMYVWAPPACPVSMEVRRALESLELELWVVVNCGSWDHIFWKSRKCS